MKRETIFVSSGDNDACCAEFMAHLKGMGIAATGPFPLHFTTPVRKSLDADPVDTAFYQVSTRYECDDETLRLLMQVVIEIEAGHPATL